jgi:hypothetical protein
MIRKQNRLTVIKILNTSTHITRDKKGYKRNLHNRQIDSYFNSNACRIISIVVTGPVYFKYIFFATLKHHSETLKTHIEEMN